MSRLIAFLSSPSDDVPADSSVESYPLHELHPEHTYPPPPQPVATSASTHTYPPESALLNEELAMSICNPWEIRDNDDDDNPTKVIQEIDRSVGLRDDVREPIRRIRDDDGDDRPNKVLLKEVDQSARLRDDVRELHYSHHELLLRKRHVQTNAHSRESEMQSVIEQYRQKLESLQHEKVQALSSLEQQHRNEIVVLQNRMAFGIDEVGNAARAERDHMLAEREAVYHRAKETMLAENEMELTRLNAQYSSRNALLDSQLRQAHTAASMSLPAWRHLIGKRPVATCTNIIGFSPIPDVHSESLADEEHQTATSADTGRPLTSLLANVPIENATVGMLAEVLAKALQVQPISSRPGPRSRRRNSDHPVEYFTDLQRRDNKSNVRELFKATFHYSKDEQYMLYDGASREDIESFMNGTGPGPDPLALQWDMTTTHKSDWNQLVISILLTLYLSMEEKNHWSSRSHQSITHDVTSKFDQCRKCWRKAQPVVRNDGTRESMQEVGDRLVEQTNERLRLARTLTRRATKFETRQKVTSTLLSDRNATGKDDLPVWVYLNSIVETLDKDGMSSDESDIDDCEVQVFRVKSMPWRADFSHELRIIDEQRLAGAAIFTPRGSKPAKRLHNPKRESLRPAVAGLPRAFYNPSWLGAQRPMFKVSNIQFQRIEIMVARK